MVIVSITIVYSHLAADIEKCLPGRWVSELGHVGFSHVSGYKLFNVHMTGLTKSPGALSLDSVVKGVPNNSPEILNVFNFFAPPCSLGWWCSASNTVFSHVWGEVNPVTIKMLFEFFFSNKTTHNEMTLVYYSIFWGGTLRRTASVQIFCIWQMALTVRGNKDLVYLIPFIQNDFC